MRHLILLALCFVCACAAPLNIQDMSIEQMQSFITYEKSEFDSVGTYQSIPLNDSEITLFKSQSSSVTLRSFESDIRVSHQLYFYITYSDSDWRFYNGINLVGGRTLDTDILDRNVIGCGHALGCTYSETLTLDVTGAVFEDALKRGLRFRLNSRFSDNFWEYNIPANFFIAQNKYIKNN